MQLPIKRKLDKYLGWLLIGIFLPPTRLLGMLLRRNHGIEEPPRQILFIKLLGLGSLVLASDAIKAMRRQWPDTRFILLTDSNIADGIGPFHLFDEIWSCRSGRLPATLADALRFLLQSWKRRKLWVADLEVYSKLTTVFSLLTFARNRFGFSLSPVFFRKYLNTHNVPFNQLGPLEDNYVYMARATTGTTLPVYPVLKTRRDEYRKPYIVLNNTCSELAPHRKLPEQTFAQVCQWILDNTSYRLALLGAAADREAMNNMIERHSSLSARRDRIFNMAGTGNSFVTYYHFLQEKGAFLVTIDSGPLHIAKRLGLPTISLWGPTNPDHYLKIHPAEEGRHLYFYSKVPCSPCVHRHEQLPCGGDNICMKQLGVHTVIEQIQAMLQHLAAPVPV